VTRRVLVVALLASVLLGTAAATIADPRPGALDPDPIFRQQPPGGSLPDPGERGDESPPGISLPGVGVTVPIPLWSLPSWLRGILVVTLAIVALALVGRSLRRAERSERLDAVEDSTPSDPEAAVADAAGRAADRLLADTDASVENEVYRAWREMTHALEVDAPASSTPGEFAEAAVAVGLDPTDVQTLTDLFEEVRYGGAAVTDERREAVARALEGIEDRLDDSEEGEQS
jgi:hypothetical protein